MAGVAKKTGVPRSPGADPPLESILKPARELDCRERLLTPRPNFNTIKIESF